MKNWVWSIWISTSYIRHVVLRYRDFLNFSVIYQDSIQIRNILQEGLGLHPRDENGRTLYSDVNFVDTWKAMENCVKSGLTRSIGV